MVDSQLTLIAREIKIDIETHEKYVKNRQNHDVQGSLQAHLTNAQYIFDLMNLDAKPLLVFFTDCTSSLQELHKDTRY